LAEIKRKRRNEMSKIDEIRQIIESHDGLNLCDDSDLAVYCTDGRNEFSDYDEMLLCLRWYASGVSDEAYYTS